MSGSTIESPRPQADRSLGRGLGHPLYPWRPKVRDLALGLSRDAGRVVVVTDAAGDVLWVDGEPTLVEQARELGLAPGVRWAGWAETRSSACIEAPEERWRSVTKGWGCWASPVFDPQTQDLLGVLAVCGPDGSNDTVRAVARLAEELVRLDRLPPPAGVWADLAAGPDGVQLRVLGPGLPVAEVAGVPVPLTPRRADIVFLLARHADGLSADALAQELYGDTGNPLTVRVEVHRIRALLGDRLASAPYRFTVPVTTDADVVLRLLACGRIDEAVLRYTGPLLPHSGSLRIELLRAELHQTVRAAALRASGDALAVWCGRDVGEGDAEALGRYGATLSPLDPVSLFVQARLAQLELEASPACNPHATSATGHWRHG